LVIDKKVALIDAVKAIYTADLVRIIKDCLGFGKVDYLIINHIEPDHSGAITILRDIYPDMEIIGNVKTLEYLSDLYGIREKVRAIEDGEVLDLGRHRLKFFITPMVHWPETMMTYEESERILFSGDVFGGFGMVDGGLFDDETDAGEWYEEEALRYFSNVIGKYSAMVQKALTRIQEVDLRITAPTHGLLWRGSPRRIVDLYDRWSRYEMETSA
ncbi:MAG: MBL fold metallo-hydrolase, partial [bacterium]